MIVNNQMEECLSGVEGLPALPLVLQQIQKVMNNPRSSMGQIAAIVAKDQALASRAIRLVNSAFYARSSRVVSIQQTIVVLGLKTLKNLMLGLSVIKMFSNSRILGFDPRAFWEHSFGTAMLARKIAAVVGHPDKEECFIAGLLHDMGRLVMEQYLHDDYLTALSGARETKESLILHERKVFGFSHGDAGGYLARSWKIPLPFILAMELHHSPDQLMDIHSEIDRKLVKITMMANELCIKGRIGDSGEHDTLTSVLDTDKYLNASMQNSFLSEARNEVAAAINEWTRM